MKQLVTLACEHCHIQIQVWLDLKRDSYHCPSCAATLYKPPKKK